MFVAGVLVHTRQRDLDAVLGAVAAVGGAEVHGANERGQIVVTVEGNTRRETADAMTALSNIEHVLNVSLVYEESEIETEYVEATQ
jgi:nitrate reductase NapD